MIRLAVIIDKERLVARGLSPPECCSKRVLTSPDPVILTTAPAIGNTTCVRHDLNRHQSRIHALRPDTRIWTPASNVGEEPDRTIIDRNTDHCRVISLRPCLQFKMKIQNKLFRLRAKDDLWALDDAAILKVMPIRRACRQDRALVLPIGQVYTRIAMHGYSMCGISRVTSNLMLSVPIVSTLMPHHSAAMRVDVNALVIRPKVAVTRPSRNHQANR